VNDHGTVSPVLYGRILVGTDGSATAGRAVDRAVALAKATGATVTIVSVGPRGADVVAREAARHAATGVVITTEARTGDPASVLVELTEQGGYGLLVVGNKGMTGAARFFLGSVPNKISHHAHASLLIVRTTVSPRARAVG
jgi:nucleotide-binding universal stress UspA family protein